MQLGKVASGGGSYLLIIKLELFEKMVPKLAQLEVIHKLYDTHVLKIVITAPLCIVPKHKERLPNC